VFKGLNLYKSSRARDRVSRTRDQTRKIKKAFLFSSWNLSLLDKLCTARQSERLGMCIYCGSRQDRSNSLYCVISQSQENGNCRACKNPWVVCELRTQKCIDDYGAERWSEDTTWQA